MSYDAKKIHTFQPGKGFTIVSSTDEKEVGTVVEGVEEIYINQYFEDKKQGKISPSPEKYILSETTKINQKDNDSQDTGEIE